MNRAVLPNARVVGGARTSEIVTVAPGVRAELRPQASGSIVYTLLDRYSRAIGAEEIFGSYERALASAKAFASELLARSEVRR